MAIDLSGLNGVLGGLGDVASKISLQDIVGQAAAGALVTIGIAGVKSQEGQDKIDFLHLFHKPATAAAPAVSGAVQGNVMTMTQYDALSADNKAMVKALHYTILPS